MDFNQIWQEISKLDTIGQVVFFGAVGFMVVSLVFMLALLIMAPNSIKSGSDFATEFHRVSTGQAIPVRRRIFFAFKWWPITMMGEQTLPYFTAKFKRFFYILSSLEWCTYGVCRKQHKAKFYLMIFSNVICNIAVIAGLAFIAYGWATPEGELQGFTKGFMYLTGAATIIFGFAMQIYPTYVMKRYMLPYVQDMNISDKDKSRIRFAVNVQFFLAIAALIMNILRLVNDVLNKDKQKRR